MENENKNPSTGNKQSGNKENDAKAKVKDNKYTPEEKPFADGEGTKLDDAIDSSEASPATRGE